MVRAYHEQLLISEQIQLETQVAERLAGKKPGKPPQQPQLPAIDVQQLSVRKKLQLLGQLHDDLPKNHRLAPCVLHGNSHTNGDCRKQQQQPALPAGAAYMSSDSPAGAGSSNAAAVDMIAAALSRVMQGSQTASGGSGAGHRNNDQRGRQQQRQQGPCGVCGREEGHPGACYYDRPDKAHDR
ncbi:hypothetical protein COO60DRAFT_1195959 [Scenedesmus sp. NREL 46B-D3]|nr:hypothetical protein COO60DRAFT_1195959 [Scenedesmus sp. NREL 46B-D3]